MYRWTEKPPLGSQINWSHPLSKGLVGAWLMNEGAGNKVNDLAFRNNGVGENITWNKKNINFNGSSSNIIIPDNSKLAVTNEYSFEFIFKPNDLTATQSILNKVTYINNYNNNGYDLYFAYPEDSRLYLTHFRNESNYYNFNYNFYFLQYHVVITYKNNSVSLYVNGLFKDSGTIQPPYASTNNMCFGGTDWRYNGGLELFRIYNKSLSPSEIKDLYISPYQFIYKPRRVFYSIPAGVTTWGHKIWGILNANIGKVNQVDKSNINKVNNA